MQWYLGSEHKKEMAELGEKDASPETQQFFHKALCNSSYLYRWGIKDPTKVPIKKNNIIQQKNNYCAITGLTGIWINPQRFDSYSKEKKEYIAYHEIAHLLQRHALKTELLNLKYDLLNSIGFRYPTENEYIKINKKLHLQKELEADKSAVKNLYKIGRTYIVEKRIQNKLTTKEHRLNMEKSLTSEKKFTEAIKTLSAL